MSSHFHFPFLSLSLSLSGERLGGVTVGADVIYSPALTGNWLSYKERQILVQVIKYANNWINIGIAVSKISVTVAASLRLWYRFFHNPFANISAWYLPVASPMRCLKTFPSLPFMFPHGFFFYFETVYPGKCAPTFRSNILPPNVGLRWRQYVAAKC